MRKIWAAAILVPATIVAVPAFAQAPLQTVQTALANAFGRGAEIVPNVAPGDELIIACAPIEQRDAKSDVRVVLTISAMPDEIPPGYKKVLATEEQLGKYGVRVRVPDVPNLPDHTVNLDVYVVGNDRPQDCDGGHLKVVAKRGGGNHDRKSAPIS
ncbi:MAG TPA: hypothetical protein VGF62_04130 [Rhizomicrobium sp.]